MSDFIKKASDNIYHDLGFEDASVMKIKADITTKIHETMLKKNISIETAAKLSGMAPERISAILDGHFHDMNEYDLLQFLLQLGNDLEITVKPSADVRGHILISNETIICEG